jgi:hypothetical protein
VIADAAVPIQPSLLGNVVFVSQSCLIGFSTVT